MRGKVVPVDFLPELFGITPAYAGKRAVKHTIEHLHGDHPRVCGEKVVTRCLPQEGFGSPPRMRGKENKAIKTIKHTRITPAYAGKSTASKINHFAQKDHPRVCGEKTKKIP